MDELIVPDWPAPSAVRALVTTRAFGDLRAVGEGRVRIRDRLPGEPLWLRQVHGREVASADTARVEGEEPEADAAVARMRGRVCAVLTADCLPVLIASRAGDAVGVAHAGWRGLAAGVIEATAAAMRGTEGLLAWLGPAIGPSAYEVGDDVRDAFRARDARALGAFSPSRPGHWRLDLYAIARQRLAASGVTRVFGGGFCTHAEASRFYSWRRDRALERMAALIWLA